MIAELFSLINVIQIFYLNVTFFRSFINAIDSNSATSTLTFDVTNSGTLNEFNELS